MTGVAIAVVYWRRRSPGRKRGRPENGRPYEGWKMSKLQWPFKAGEAAGMHGSSRSATTESRADGSDKVALIARETPG